MSDNRHHDAPDVADRFAQLLAHEPPFDTGLGDSLDAAVRGGRRRRARAIAGKVVAVAACGVVLTGGYVAVHPSDAPAPVAGGTSPSTRPAASTGRCSTDSGTGPSVQVHHGSGPSPVATAHPLAPAAAGDGSVRPVASAPASCPVSLGDPAVTDAELTALASRVVAAAATDATSTKVLTPGTLVVTTAAGQYLVSVSVTAEQFDAAERVHGCTPSTVDAKPCTVERTTASDFAGSVRFSDGSGRADLLYAAAIPPAVGSSAARTVDVVVDNYVEQHSGDKLVGPTWHQVGLTPAAVAAVISASSGLLS